MKRPFKSLIAAVLCAVIAITGIGMDTARAAESKPPLKVTFNGTSVSLIKVLGDGSEKAVTVGAVVKKLGSPDKKEKIDDFYTRYVWKKGKSSIEFTNYKQSEDADDFLCHFDVHLQGRKDALFGIKVGMKKENALKKLKKTFGKNNVCAAKEGQVINFESGKPVPQGKPDGKGEDIFVYAYSNVLSLRFSLKDGLVSSMGFSS